MFEMTGPDERLTLQVKASDGISGTHATTSMMTGPSI